MSMDINLRNIKEIDLHQQKPTKIISTFLYRKKQTNKLNFISHLRFFFLLFLTGEATDDQPFVPNNEKPTEYDPNLYLYSVCVISIFIIDNIIQIVETEIMCEIKIAAIFQRFNNFPGCNK